MTKQQHLSALILAKVAQGTDVMTAAKEVLGADAVDAMISELYDTLRNRA